MKVCDLIEKLGLSVLCGQDLEREVKGGYTSDLLSDVMGHIDEGMVWITMQTHQNVIAVAALKDVAAVILVNGNKPDEETLSKGNEENVLLLGTRENAFETSGKLYQLLNQGEGRPAHPYLPVALRKPGYGSGEHRRDRSTQRTGRNRHHRPQLHSAMPCHTRIRAGARFVGPCRRGGHDQRGGPLLGPVQG